VRVGTAGDGPSDRGGLADRRVDELPRLHGNIVISTTGDGSYTVSADGKVTEGPDEVGAAGLPVTMPVDD
jgi:hypothetical protein